MGKRLLLVDIGNSRVKWGRTGDGGILPGPAFPSAAAGLAGYLDGHWSGLEPPRAIHVSNVAGAEIAAALADWVARRWGSPLRFARSEAAACGIANGYDRPETLGVDRWVGLIGLRRYYGLPACLADCGTALTFDVVDAAGRHLGGMIAPGLAAMKRALLTRTHGVTVVEVANTHGFLGRNTAAGVDGGVLHACSGLLETSVRKAGELLGRSPALVLTGGDGAAVGRSLAIRYRFDADLVLRGLLTLAENET